MNLPRCAIVATFSLLLVSPVVLLRAQDGPPQQDAGQRGQGRMGLGRGVRGTVTTVAGPNVTLRTEAGETWTVITTDNTRMMIDQKPVKPADLKPGDEVIAAGIPDADKHEVHAMFVMGASAAQVARLKADMGKTYIVGRVTAINETKLTVERPDHVAQTITLDETTSLKRGGRLPAELMGATGGGMFMGRGGPGGRGNGQARPGNSDEPRNDANTGGMPAGAEGEAITLADIKIGDNIAGTGSVKNGSFTPTDLHVLVRPQRGPRTGNAAPPPQ